MTKLPPRQAILHCVRNYNEEGLIDEDHEISKKEAKKFHQAKLAKKFNLDFFIVMNLLRYYKIILPVKLTGKPDKLVFKPGKLDLVLSGDDAFVAKRENRVVVSQNLAFYVRKETSSKSCDICNKLFETEEALHQHNKDKGHVITKLLKHAKNADYFERNGAVVAEITRGMKNAPETIFNDNTQFSVILCITNNTTKDIILDNIEGVNRDLNKFVEIVFEHEYVIEPTEMYNVHLNFTFKARRAYRMPLTITYDHIIGEGETEIKGFNKQLIFEIVADKYAILQPTSPYRRSKPIASDLDETIVPGEKPEFQSDFKAVHNLKPYPLTADYITIFNSGLKQDRISQSLHKRLREINQLLDVEEPDNCLTEYNYREMLDLLLYLEEHQMKIDIRHYDTTTNQITLIRNNQYKLEVPELSENRPSLMIGDSVYVKEVGAEIKYEGIVHEKFLDSVQLGFNTKFSNIFIAKKEFAVSFGYNRTTLKIEHQAAYLARNCAKYFFPTVIVPSTNVEEMPSLNCYNRNINNNAQQLQAVQEIIKGSVTNVPYLIFGPPGTGKTMTVVEAILQVRKFYPNSAILVSTPSNSAANLITGRLLDNRSFSEKELLRYISYSYSVSEIPEKIKKYCNLQSGAVCHPTMESLKEFKVLITTLTTAGRLYNVGIPREHFSYVFIDEAGHATETETLIPITAALVDGEKVTGRVILAGDPEQLGPIIHSTKAKTYGFGISMLERFMKTMPIYSRHEDTGYDNRVLTKLLKNYRSHPDIIAFSNEEFYYNELICEGGPIPNTALGHELLPNKKFPIIFHSVLGIDQRESKSPSFFNIQEIQTVFEYLDKLVGTRMSGVLIKAQDIAVVTPYRKQVQKIRRMCEAERSGRFDNLEVGSIEKLQGQERLIVIISTVRSKPEFVQHDVKFHLGFLKNPKRMNVALTRAKALLIVIGNPNLLKHDKHWGKFISRCDDNNATTGAAFSLDVDDELLRGFENITIEESVDDIEFGRGNR